MNQRSISMVLTMALDSVDPFRLTNQHILLSNTKVCIGKTEYPNINHIIVIAMGKASVAMTQAAVEKLGDRITRGVCVCKNLPKKLPEWNNIELIQGSHPVPDARSLEAGNRISECLHNATANDLVLVLISGGASSLVGSPVKGVGLDDLRKMNSLLLDCGATINEMNAVRKHLDLLKGGGLLKAAAPAKVHTLVLSDVIGDDLSVIASGPTTYDPTSFSDAWRIFEKYRLLDRMPKSVVEYILAGTRGDHPETVKPGDKNLERVENSIVGSNSIALDAAVAEAERMGMKSIVLSRKMTGEAREMGKWFVEESQKIAGNIDGPVMVATGGETTVTIHGNGKGGRNQELALAGVKQMAGDKNGILVTLATDGEDGPTNAAGAIVTAETMERASALGLDPDDYLSNNDAYSFFEKVNGLLVTGPTGTNVNDLTFYFRFA